MSDTNDESGLSLSETISMYMGLLLSISSVATIGELSKDGDGSYDENNTANIMSSLAKTMLDPYGELGGIAARMQGGPKCAIWDEIDRVWMDVEAVDEYIRTIKRDYVEELNKLHVPAY